MVFAPFAYRSVHHPVWGPSFARPNLFVVVDPDHHHERMDVDSESDKHETSGETGSIVFRGQNLQVTEKPTCFEFQLDLPGVQPSGVKIEALEEGILHIEAERTFGRPNQPKLDQKYAFDEDLIDRKGIRSNLVDGVLTITLPKKEQKEEKKPDGPEPMDVKITLGYVPEANDGQPKRKTVFALDIPGVSADHVKLGFRKDNDYLILRAERVRGGTVVSKIHHAISVDTKKIDVDHMEAFLADGVLQIVAPEKKPVEPTVVPVTSIRQEEEVPKLEEGIKKKARVSVETVDEKEEAMAE